jgi:molybdopterin molybdotransferase
MLTFEDAYQVAINQALSLGVESVSFEEGPGRVLAEDIFSDLNMPPFDKSAMDGYACRREDLGGNLKVIEVIRAGIPPERSIGPGECSQIMTGAIVPVGADVVLKVEETEILSPGIIRFTGEKTANNICYIGEDIRLGEKILEAGTLLKPQHVPVLASVGAIMIRVYRFPAVGIVATGTELVEPGEIPEISQIRNTNAYQMIAQLSSMGIDPDYYGIAPDIESETEEILARAIESADIIILSGGVSMGEFDFVPSVLEKIGMRIHFNKVAIQPGKPTLFASGNGKFVFGLPGNPVSSYLTLEFLVKPFIYACMNLKWPGYEFRMKLGLSIQRKKSNRLGWVPVALDQDGSVTPLEYHGSAHINSLRDAFGVVSVPIGVTSINQGDWVNVRPL